MGWGGGQGGRSVGRREGVKFVKSYSVKQLVKSYSVKNVGVYAYFSGNYGHFVNNLTEVFITKNMRKYKTS